MYQQSNSITRMLMEATVCEQRGFIMKAGELYRKAARTGKKNKLARNLYKSFLWDYDIIE